MNEFWNQRYAEEVFAYGVEPNEFFAQQLIQIKSGKLLLPAEGEGRNAVFAAKEGWSVDAFDFSTYAKQKASDLATKNQVSINYLLADFDAFEAEPASYDVIGLIYAHMPSELRAKTHRKMLHLLKPGGKIILEAFHKTQLGKTSGGPQTADLLYSEEELRADFTECSHLDIKQENITLREGLYHAGEAAVIRLIATL